MDGQLALDAFNHPYAYAATSDAHNLTTTTTKELPCTAQPSTAR